MKNKIIGNAGAILALAFLCVIWAACAKKITDPVQPPASGTPTAAATAIPGSTNQPTAIPTDTPKPTKTPTPISAEAQTLYNQYEKKLETAEYKTMLETFSKGEYGFPAISITTKDSAPVYSKESTIACVVSTMNCADEYKLATTAKVRVRGNSSAYAANGKYDEENRAKYPTFSYPYKIKFDEKTNLFGLNSGNSFKEWVLLKQTGYPNDNLYPFMLAHALYGDRYYASDVSMVHVYINGKYMGLYTLCEQSEAKKNRVDVNEPKEDYTGTDIGYFLEIDNYAKSEENPCFKLNHHNKATVTDVQGLTKTFKARYYTIHSDITSKDQTDFIKKYMENVFDIVYEAVENKKFYALDENWNKVDASSTYKNAKDCISAVMDLDSVVYSYLIEEITTDYDRGEGSFYMAVDFSAKSKYQKLTFLCPWDFEYGYAYSTKKQLVAGGFDDFSNGDRANYWFILLMKESWFRDMVREKWNEFYKGGAYDTFKAEMLNLDTIGKSDLEMARVPKKEDKSWSSLTSFKTLTDKLEKRIIWLDENWFGNDVKR